MQIRISTQTKFPVILLVTLFVVQIPFALLMPFHIDDGIFLRITDSVSRDPLMPLREPVIWEGQLWSDMMSYSHPPLLCYYLYGIRALSGEWFELLAHFAFVPFFLLFAGAMYYLLRFLKLPAVLGTLLAVFSPLMFTLSHTIMMDVPTAAFGLAGIVLGFYGFRDYRIRYLIWAGVCNGIAILISYTAVFYLLPVTFYALLLGRPRRQILLYFLPPAGLFAAWLLLILAVTGRFLPLDVLDLLRAYEDRPHTGFLPRFFYTLVMTGGTMLFPVILLFWRWRYIRGKLYLMAVFPLSLLVRDLLPGEGFFHQVALSVLAVAGFILLLESLLVAFGRPASLDADGRAAWRTLGAWVIVFFLATLFAFPCGAARYQVWILPPLLAAFLHSGGAFSRRLLRQPVFLSVLIIGQVSLGGMMALADLEMARALRRGVDQVMSRYQSADNTVWIAGEWQLRHYVLAQGGRTLLRYDRRPRAGDILIKPVLTTPTYFTEYEQSAAHALRVDQVTVDSAFPFRVLNPLVRAGFYSDYWGFVPVWWVRDKAPIEILDVYLIKSSLPPNQEREKENRAGLLNTLAEDFPELPR
ncbi:MAG: glycosyltransferase family 39 protein [Acidobacteria bacterium]|nr:glycosyltransferase family 39 protein [Acidobacteriota bacterium]